MMSHCYFIPQYIEERVNTKNLLISKKFRSQRKNTHKSLILDGKSGEVPIKSYIYTAKNRRCLPGSLIASSNNEVSQTKDLDAVGAWMYSDYFIRFCQMILGLDILNECMRDQEVKLIKSTIHYFMEYNNVFFNGSQIVYGDGDGITFENFAQDPSVVFHELWHWITNRTCGLIYQDQAGALNESLSDVFASIIMQWMNGETVDEASWLIGDLCTININGFPYAVRSLADPGTAFVNHPYMGTDDQPQDMTNYYNDTEDNHGIHINSGIPNHAFYLFAKAIGGYVWDIPRKIWFKTITTPELISPNATFTEFAQATIAIAMELYSSSDPSIIDKLRNAWQAVKVL